MYWPAAHYERILFLETSLLLSFAHWVSRR